MNIVLQHGMKLFENVVYHGYHSYFYIIDGRVHLNERALDKGAHPRLYYDIAYTDDSTYHKILRVDNMVAIYQTLNDTPAYDTEEKGLKHVFHYNYTIEESNQSVANCGYIESKMIREYDNLLDRHKQDIGVYQFIEAHRNKYLLGNT